jgi:hypothetical protein
VSEFTAKELLVWATGRGRSSVDEAFRLLAANPPSVSTPEVAYAERLSLAMAFALHADLGAGDVRWLGVDDEARGREFSGFVSSLLMASSVYVWSNAMRLAASGGHTLGEMYRQFVGVPAQLQLPTWACWFTWETDAKVDGTHMADLLPPESVHLGVLLAQTAYGAVRSYNIAKQGDVLFAWGGDLPSGVTVPEPTDEGIPMMWGEFAATGCLLAFLESPYIPKVERHLGRPARRRAERVDAPWATDSTTFIQLRRPEPGSSANLESEAAHVAWACQWIVSGHFRRQWYPKDETHRVIWVAPYIKGPDGLPLKERAFKVAR